MRAEAVGVCVEVGDVAFLVDGGAVVGAVRLLDGFQGDRDIRVLRMDHIDDVGVLAELGVERRE